MKNYFDKLQRRTDKYRKKHSDNPRKAALKLFWWNFLCCFKKHQKIIPINKPVLYGEKKIALSINGGIGDYITAVNYALYLYRFLDKKIAIDIFVKNSTAIKQLFGKAVPFAFFERDSINEYSGYAVKINLNRFPEIIEYNAEYIDQYMPKFNILIDTLSDLREMLSPYYKFDPMMDALTVHFAKINGIKKRIQQPDIKGILGIKEQHLLKLKAENTARHLKKFGLKNKKFITFNRGTDTGNKENEVTRMWPVEYYEKLIDMLKAQYPEYKIVQLGYSKSWCKQLSNTDLDIRGQTSLVELKALLNASVLHVDYEGGMVHLRKALNAGPSVVLFGPTDPQWLGYDTNINICTNCCTHCENLTPSWQKECANLKNRHICMKSITPEMVFTAINNYLQTLSV